MEEQATIPMSARVYELPGEPPTGAVAARTAARRALAAAIVRAAPTLAESAHAA
jgi:hypothetical protein